MLLDLQVKLKHVIADLWLKKAKSTSENSHLPTSSFHCWIFSKMCVLNNEFPTACVSLCETENLPAWSERFALHSRSLGVSPPHDGFCQVTLRFLADTHVLRAKGHTRIPTLGTLRFHVVGHLGHLMLGRYWSVLWGGLMVVVYHKTPWGLLRHHCAVRSS